ncbi:hypothetical protein [Mucilaginibacter phyllosphaerae]
MEEFDPLNVYNFFFEVPLYAEIFFDKDRYSEVIDILTKSHKVDAYNPILKENSTYVGKSDYVEKIYTNIMWYDKFHNFTFKCTRHDHIVKVNVLLEKKDNDNYSLTKIGQYPSIADFHISRIKDYGKVLPTEQMKEFSKAIGLVSHGVGVGSFVYLRRVFEHLIEEAHQHAIRDEGFDDATYKANRVDERIQQLNNYLPDFLVENRKLYGILSKGIHELTENECLNYFEAVKVGIELILDEKLEKYEKNKKKEKARALINSTHSQIKNKE